MGLWEAGKQLFYPLHGTLLACKSQVICNAVGKSLVTAAADLDIFNELGRERVGRVCANSVQRKRESVHLCVCVCVCLYE